MYEKRDSFVEIRHQRLLEDVTARIRRVHEHLVTAGRVDDAATIVKHACEELLGHPRAAGERPPFTLYPFVVEEISRVTDAELPRYLFYRYRYDTFSQRKLLDDFPPCLQIEPSSVCNYRCVFCIQTDQQFTKKSGGHMGVMSLETFTRIIDQAEGRCEAITLASRGEPLLCRDLKKMLAYAGGKFLALKLNTNAWYLDEDVSHAILQAEVNTLVFSADAVSEPTYSRFRVGGKLERVLDNIKRFREIRAADYPHSRMITRVSGVQVPETPDLDDMEAVWGDLVDQVAFVKYNPWENTYERPVNGLTAPCSDLWRRMFVWWDGTVNPCDVDYRSTLAVGNAGSQELGALWRSEAYEGLREQHLLRQRSQCSPCNRCTVV